MRPEQPAQTPPQFQIGQRVEATINDIIFKPKKSDENPQGSKYGPQYQFELTLKPSGYQRRAWIQYYPVPQPNQYLGQLCLAIERVVGQPFQTLDGAIQALKSYGKIYVKVKGFKQGTQQQPDGTFRMFPTFSVVPDVLPGEQPYQQPPQITPPSAAKLDLSTETLNWVSSFQHIIGKRIPDTVYNSIALTPIPAELTKLGIMQMIDDYPVLTEKARNYL